MKKFSYLLAFAIAFLSLASCDDGTTSGDPVDNKPDAYHPLYSLNVGNRWDYQKSLYKEDGTLDGNQKSYYLKIVKDSLIDGVKTALFMNGTDDDYELGYANKADGLYVWNDDKSVEGKLTLQIKYPIVKGDSYYVFTDRTYKIEEVNKSVTVPAGAFNCVMIKINYNDAPGYEYAYFAKNVGIIKWERYSEKEGGSGLYLYKTEELLSKNF